MTKPAAAPRRWALRRPLARRDPGRPRRLPRGLLACAAIAFVNALVWAALTPIFQVPDEPVHVGYAEYVASHGKLPRDLGAGYYPAPDADAAFRLLPFSITGKPNWSADGDRQLHRQVDAALHDPTETGAGYVANNPPLYYLLEAVPDRLAGGGDFLDRVMAMRLLSALLAALTTAFVFLFVREVLPAEPWAWALGALAVAFQPVFGFISGGVNNDTLLWTAGAGLFLALARSFRRGLTVRRGAAIGLALGAAFLTKGTAYALIPGTAIGVALCLRGPLRPRSPALRGALVAGALGALAVGGWIVASRYLVHRSGGAATAGFTTAKGTISISGQLSYIWQFYLPRLPSMHDWFPHSFPLWDSYFKPFVGRFGWFQYGFPDWVYRVALVPAVGLVALACVGFFRARAAVLRRWREAVTYLLLGLGVVALVNVAGYRYFQQNGVAFEQVRYLFALLPLYALLVAVAARAAGRRWAVVVGVAVLTLVIADSVFSQLLTLARYYA